MNHFKVEPVTGYEVDCWFVDDDGMPRWLDHLSDRETLTIDQIGTSRQGREMFGMRVGQGPVLCTVTAGAHADEPAGPMTAMILAEFLSSDHPDAVAGREIAQFIICPQVNPDGAQANAPWFTAVPDFRTYLQHVKRELPGDDIEFGYPGNGKTSLRPENEAVARYLGDHPPASVHLSLHSMAFASGAWFLLGGQSAEMHQLLQKVLAGPVAYEGFGLHDIDRNGDKGFHRLGLGFCTTPDSRAMAQHFINQGDHQTAAKFHLSSMEWTLERNPSAHILVTELPMFALDNGFQENRPADFDEDNAPANPEAIAPQPGSTTYEKFREQLRPLLAERDITAAVQLANDFHLKPVPFSAQCQLMFSTSQLMARLGYIELARNGF